MGSQGDVHQHLGACSRWKLGPIRVIAQGDHKSYVWHAIMTSIVGSPSALHVWITSYWRCVLDCRLSIAVNEQVRNSVEVAVAQKPAVTVEETFNFAAYMKERATLVNEALDKAVPMQYPEIINESMRWPLGPQILTFCLPSLPVSI